MTIEPGAKIRIGRDNYTVEGKEPDGTWRIYKIVKDSCWAKKGRKVTTTMSTARLIEISTEEAIQGTLSDIFQKSPSGQGTFRYGRGQVKAHT